MYRIWNHNLLLLLFLKTTRKESEHSLQGGSSSTLSSSYDYDLEMTSSEEKLVTSLQKKTAQMPAEEPGQERVSEPVKGERRRDKRVSYFDMRKEKEAEPKARPRTDSLVSISSKDILFQKDDQAKVYPLVRVTRFCVSPVL